MSRLFSTGDVSEATGLPPNTIDDWTRAGLLTPVEASGGRGLHRRWSIAHAVALKFVAEWRNWGAGPPLLFPMLRHFGAITDAEYLAAFDAGRTHVMSLPNGDLVAPPPPNVRVVGLPLSMFDVSRVYREVSDALADRPKPVRGRRRRYAIAEERK